MKIGIRPDLLSERSTLVFSIRLLPWESSESTAMQRASQKALIQRTISGSVLEYRAVMVFKIDYVYI